MSDGGTVGKETEILVEQQPPQGVFVCDHAGLVINKFSRQEGATVRDMAAHGFQKVASAFQRVASGEWRVRDQICSTQGPKVNWVRQVDFR